MCQLCVCTRGWDRTSYLQMLLDLFRCLFIPFCRMPFKDIFPAGAVEESNGELGSVYESFYSIRHIQLQKVGLILKVPLNIFSKNMLSHT